MEVCTLYTASACETMFLPRQEKQWMERVKPHTGVRLGEHLWEYETREGERGIVLRYEQEADIPCFSFYSLGQVERVTVGKGREHTICYEGFGLVSGNHVCFTRCGEEWQLEDTSTNGTFLAGKRVGSGTVAFGEQVEIFGLTLFFLKDTLVLTCPERAFLMVDLPLCKGKEMQLPILEEKRVTGFFVRKTTQRFLAVTKKMARSNRKGRQEERYPSAATCATLGPAGDGFWGRNPGQEAFLWLRVGVCQGTGQVAGLNLQDCRSLGILGDRVEAADQVLRVLLLQLFNHVSYSDVCVAVIGSRQHAERSGCWQLRWLLHNWSEDRKLRYFATNPGQTITMLQKLENECRYVVLVVLEPQWMPAGELRTKAGYTVVTSVDNLEKLPENCGQVLQIRECVGELYHLEKQERLLNRVRLDELERPLWEEGLRELAQVRLQQQSRPVPEAVNFYELYRIQKAEELPVEENWRKQHTWETLQAKLGIGENGQEVLLDLHELADGPHGLLAGTTGAGKSQLLQTLLLALAVTYSPVELQFLLLDYKGGDMSAAVEELPHVAGVMTNLDPVQLNRGLDAVFGELRRRQQLLQKEGFSHVDVYNRKQYRENLEPLAHLLVVVDEFAELKREVPEFLEGLLSVSRVGRSLGVHLLLATQKPGGVVDANLWSNANFRLCLAVQEEEDSMELLHSNVAAGKYPPGRCWLTGGRKGQVTALQTAWCGQSASWQAEQQVHLLDSMGSFLGEKEERGEQPTQCECLVQQIGKIASNLGIAKRKPLWLPLLPKRLDLEAYLKETIFAGNVLSERKQKSGTKEHPIWLGLCDDPERQRQYPLYLLPEQYANMVLIGKAGSGKTTFLRQMVKQWLGQFSSDQLWIYWVDFLGSWQEELSRKPHVGGLLDTEEGLEKCLYLLRQECDRRESLQKKSRELEEESEKEGFPVVWLLLDNMAQIRQSTQDRYLEAIYELFRRGPGVGIYLLVTGGGFGPREIPSLWRARFGIKYAFFDREMAASVFPGYALPKQGKSVPGRALVLEGERLLEFQAFFSEEDWHCREDDRELTVAGAPPVTLLPSPCTFHWFEEQCSLQQKEEDANGIPFCLRELDGSVVWLPTVGMDRFLLVGERMEQVAHMGKLLLGQLAGRVKELVVLGSQNRLLEPLANEKKIPYYTEKEECFSCFQ